MPYIWIFLITLLPLAAKALTYEPFITVMEWHAAETNANFVSTLTFPDNTTNFTATSVHFDTKPAFRAGLSLFPKDHSWDTQFSWTHFSTHSSSAVPTSLSNIVSSLLFSGSYFLSSDVFFGYNSKWTLNMNLLNMAVSHTFTPFKGFELTPKFGLQGGVIDQAININWDAILYQASEYEATNYLGIGPSFGLGSKVNIYKGINLVGDVTAALMYGRWNMSDIYNRPAAYDLITQTTITSKMHQSQQGSLMTDYYVGLEWKNKNVLVYTLRIGYEMQYWANQLRLIAIQQLPVLGDLTLEGATCGIYIDL